ncbi:MAG: response regulator [Proteobacteria bacterium]|nr:response regulator [Pseudomonadota bacterium]
MRKTVLMIEDNPADAEIIREELSMAQSVNFAVETVTTLADGLSYIEEHDVSGVLLDLSLPDSEGIETFKKTRAQAPELAIVVLTGNDDEQLGLQAVREGAQDYIVKGSLNGAGLARAVEYAIERKQMEARHRRVRKMEAVINMSMGIVNDFNNVLATILMKLQVLEWPRCDDEILLEEIGDVRRAVFQGANLTNRLAAFSKSDSLLQEVIDINEQITDSAGLVSAIAGPGIEVVTKLCNDIWHVHIDPLDLETSLVDLVANAKESMPDSGRITITTRNVVVADGEYAENNAGPGSYVVLSISDVGVGMSEIQRQHAIEPYFTTKTDTKGLGLGLSMVFGFIRQSKGFMHIDSDDGIGTCVQLFFPQYADKAS